MEKQPFTLDIVTLKQIVFSEPITSVLAPGSEGYFGIHAGHTPFVSSLQAGVIKIGKADGGTQILATSGGFLMTDRKKVILLADTAERPEEIDVNRAQAAKERAERRLAERSEGTDIDRAKAALLRAVTRIRVAGR
jgi:F-type H+-transporting ATPase subunit epsilon